MTAAPTSSSSAPTPPGRPTTAGPTSSRSTTTANTNGIGAATSQVSFNRPYGKYCQILDAPLSTGSGEWFLWEFPFAYWLESQGYDVTYISNLDTHRDGRGLLRARAFSRSATTSIGPSRCSTTSRPPSRADLNVGFFSGNAVLRPHPVRSRTPGTGPRPSSASASLARPAARRIPAMKSLPHERALRQRTHRARTAPARSPAARTGSARSRSTGSSRARA